MGGPTLLNFIGDSCADGAKFCDDKAKAILEYPFILQSASLSPGTPRYGKYANFNIEFPVEYFFKFNTKLSIRRFQSTVARFSLLMETIYLTSSMKLLMKLMFNS